MISFWSGIALLSCSDAPVFPLRKSYITDRDLFEGAVCCDVKRRRPAGVYKTGKLNDMSDIRQYILVILLAAPTATAMAGDCKIQNINGQSVQTCDNGYAETTGRDGTRTYGIRNNGAERYPANAAPPYAIDRRR